MKPNRSEIKRVVDAITNHCDLNEYLNIIGITDNLMCICEITEETGFHIRCEYPIYSTLSCNTMEN